MKNRQVKKKEFQALSHVNFEVKQGESVALIGRNGSGKSTLLKCISGVMLPDGGEILTRGRVAGLIEVGAGFHPDLTGRENVYLNGAILGMTKKQIDQRFDQIVAFSEIDKFIDTEVRFYSSGMFLRLAFSVAVFSDPDLFLVDEILAVGDQPFKEKCMRRIRELQNEGKTLVIVSHSEEQIRKVCDRAIWLSRGEVKFDGEVNEALDLMNQFEESLSRGRLAELLYQHLGEPSFELTEELEASYKDVETSSKGAKGIWWLTSQGLTKGYGNGYFGPDDKATRAMLASFIYRLDGEKEVEYSNEVMTKFADVNASNVHAKAIWYLASLGRAFPIDGFNFGVKEPLTIQDFELMTKKPPLN
jgi:ABC-2 type transport system ATP-binding protein